MIIARTGLILTIVSFIALCINVICFYISLFVYFFNIESNIFHPVIGVCIPIILYINMGTTMYACDYKENIEFYYRQAKNKNINIAVYASMGFINPLFLYIHTKSFNFFNQELGILRCFPIINIFMYLKLIRKYKLLIPFRKKLIVQYFKGMLIINLIRKEII